MHTKIIDPRQDGRFVFANWGLRQKTVNYLGHNAKARDVTILFLDKEQNEIAPKEVKTITDLNGRAYAENKKNLSEYYEELKNKKPLKS